eukprot:scaffold1964_cov252-Isochrysis_galbana.AAC.10
MRSAQVAESPPAPALPPGAAPPLCPPVAAPLPASPASTAASICATSLQVAQRKRRTGRSPSAVAEICRASSRAYPSWTPEQSDRTAAGWSGSCARSADPPLPPPRAAAATSRSRSGTVAVRTKSRHKWFLSKKCGVRRPASASHARIRLSQRRHSVRAFASLSPGAAALGLPALRSSTREGRRGSGQDETAPATSELLRLDDDSGAAARHRGMHVPRTSASSSVGSKHSNPPARCAALEVKAHRADRPASHDAISARVGGDVATHEGRSTVLVTRSTSSGETRRVSCVATCCMHLNAATVDSAGKGLAGIRSACAAALQTASRR